MSAGEGPVRTLSVFFPMYNERQNIPRALSEAVRVLPTLGLDRWELIVVDDGSVDGCAALVEEAIHAMPPDGELRLVRHSKNEGYGKALQTGFAAARLDAVFYTDADLPVDLSDIARALPLLAEAQVVIGYRTGRRETLIRDVYSTGYNALMQLMFGVRVHDVNFSFKLIRRSALLGVKLSARSVFIDGELLAEARRCGLSLAEIPVAYQARRHGTSAFNSPKVVWAALREMLAYRFDKSTGST